MATPSVSDALAKWSRNLVAAVPTIKAGVLAVKRSPGEAAAAAVDRYAQGVQDAVASGTYQSGNLSYSLGDWQDATANKGTARIAAGVQAAQTKMGNFLAVLLPYTASVAERIKAMPQGGGQAAADRMMANFQMMSAFKYQKRK